MKSSGIDKDSLKGAIVDSQPKRIALLKTCQMLIRQMKAFKDLKKKVSLRAFKSAESEKPSGPAKREDQKSNKLGKSPENGEKCNHHTGLFLCPNLIQSTN